MKSETVQKVVKSPIGPLYLVATDTHLRGIFWKRQSAPIGDNEIIHRTEEELEEFFAGKRKKFSVPMEPIGTEFQKKVWKALTKIPYGKTISYRELAQAVESPKAYRAVGTANGRNPLSILVPCHRVIAADGTLGGYAGGLNTKTFLLDLEKKSEKKS